MREGQTDTDRHVYKAIHTRQAGRQAGRQAVRQAGRQADRQTDRQTEKLIKPIHTLICG